MNTNVDNNKIDLQYVIYKTEELLELTENRYKITVQIANRAKKRKYEDIDVIDDPINKPVIKTILEIVDEIIEPKILKD